MEGTDRETRPIGPIPILDAVEMAVAAEGGTIWACSPEEQRAAHAALDAKMGGLAGVVTVRVDPGATEPRYEPRKWQHSAYGVPPGVYDQSTNTIGLTIWPSELEELDVIAARNGTTRDVILRLFLKSGLESNR